MKKRITSLLIVLCAVALLSMTVFAAIVSETRGTLTYAFDSDSFELTISGKGNITIADLELATATNQPDTTKLTIYVDASEKITIPDKMCYGWDDMTDLIIYGDVEIGKEAFSGTTKLSRAIFFGDADIATDNFLSCASDFKLCGYSGSKVETYANANNITFAPLNGDCSANGDDNNVTWKLSADGTMTISGTGAMADYTVDSQAVPNTGTGGWDIVIDSDNRPWASLIDVIKKVVIKDGVTSVGQSAFDLCTNLANVDIADSVSSIGVCAFSNAALTSVVLGGDVTVKNYAFISNKLTSIVFAGNVKLDGDDIFKCDTLNSVYSFGGLEYPRDLKEMFGVSTPTFYGYTGSAVYTLVTTWGYPGYSFSPLNGTCGATETDNVTWKLSADGTMTISGTGAMADYTLTYSSGTISGDTRPWKDLVGMIKKVVVENGVTRIGAKAFAHCAEITSLCIANNINSIGGYAFYHCTKLTSVDILGTINSIDSEAFCFCSGLESVTVLGNIESIGSNAFANCGQLKSVAVLGDEGIGSIGDNAFYRNTSLKSLYILGGIYNASLDIPIGAFEDVPDSFTIYRYATSNVEEWMINFGYTSFTYSQKCFVITGGKWGTDYTYDIVNGVLTVLTDTPLTIKNMDASVAISHRIVVKKDVDANITLAGVNIDVSSTGKINKTSGYAAFLIENDSKGDVTVTLADGTMNTLKSGVSCAGIQKNGLSTETNTVGTLTIKGSGTLYATGGNDGAGIGAGYDENKSTQNIVILGGTVEAEGKGNAAGIGGSKKGSASYITIEGGKVTATGSLGSAGIGGGGEGGGNGTNITIKDGTVTAQGGAGGAGIGGGSKGAGTSITVKGGDVTAKGGDYGAGIGSGSNNNGTDIMIEDGTVIATGGKYAAGIGGGSGYADKNDGNGTNITIKGGIVTAKGGEDAAGIGGGSSNGNGSNITIENGSVTAIGGKGGAGIGGGGGGVGSNIIISGGSVKVTAGKDANTIGGGRGQSALTPTDGSNNVYLLEIDTSNSGTSTGDIVSVNGKDYPAWHYYYYFDGTGTLVSAAEPQIYVYLPDATHSVTVGNNTTSYILAGTSFAPLSGSCGASATDNVTWVFDPATGTMTVSGKGEMKDFIASSSSIPWKDFRDKIKKVVIEDGITNVSRLAFADCTNLTSVDIPDSVSSIGESAFSCTGLTSVAFGSDVELGASAFDGCENLTSVVFGADSALGARAFGDCKSLTSVYFFGNVKTDSVGEIAIGTNCFNKCPTTITLYGYSDNDNLKQYCQTNSTTLSLMNGELGSLTWRLGSDGTLTFGGSGTLNYSATDAPWKLLVDNNMVKKLVIKNGVTYESLGITPKYTVTIKDGDTIVEKHIFLTDGEKVTEPTTPTKNGYKFLGWYNGETKYDFDSVVSSDLTITAKWESPDYVGTLDAAIKDLQTAKADLESALAKKADDATINAKINAVNAAITDLQTALAGKADAADLNTLTDTVNALSDAVSVLQNAKSNYSTTTEMNNAISAAVEIAKTGLNAGITELQYRMTAAEQKVKDLTDNKADAAALTDAINNLSTLTARLNTIKTALESKDTELSGKIDDIDAALASAQTTLTNAINALTTRMTEAESKLNDLTAKANTTADELAAAISELTALTNSLNTVKGSLEAADTALEAKINSAQTTLQTAITELEKKLDKAVDDLNTAIAKGDKDLDDKITKLNEALEAAKTALTATDAANKKDLDNKITEAKTTLQAAITELEKKLDKAVDDLNTAIANGDKDLDDKITKLNDALEAAKTALAATDAANKKDLDNKITEAKTTLQAAITELEKKLDKAVDDLNTAIANGDKDLDDKITKLNEALKAVQTALEATDTANKKELDDKITEAKTTLQKAIDDLEASLDKAVDDLNTAIANGDKDLDNKITELNDALEAAKTALTATDTANKKELDDKITSAQTTLQTAVTELEKKLDKAVDDLNTAIANGDKDLDDKIAALNTALENAQKALEATDEANKKELDDKITSAQTTLQKAIDDLEASLDKAVNDLNDAISKGDKDLDDKIAALNTALENVKKALEASASADKTELSKSVSDAQTTLQAAIDKVASDLADAKAALEAKDAELQTFITVVCIIACVSLCGGIALAVWFFIDRKKRV